MAPVKVGVVLHKFEHVDGAQVCASLYPHYTLPDGTTVHYYHHDNLFDNNIVRPGRITHELGVVLLRSSCACVCACVFVCRSVSGFVCHQHRPSCKTSSAASFPSSHHHHASTSLLPVVMELAKAQRRVMWSWCDHRNRRHRHYHRARHSGTSNMH